MNANHIRKLRIILLSPALWRKRLVFWVGALLIGITASYFAIAADWAQQTFNRVLSHDAWLSLIICPACFTVAAWLTKTFCPSAPGSGIPQAIAARILRDRASRNYLLGSHIILNKMFITIIGLLGGASIGREGPTVQVGASLLLLFAGMGGMRAERGIVLAGASAGVAAAFNTPLAGIVFAIEEMARAFEHRNSSIVLAAIVFSGAAAMSITGNYDYFGYVSTELSVTRDWLAIAAVGLVGGLMGGTFCRLVLDGGKYLREAGNCYINEHPAMFAGLCGMAIAFIGLITHKSTFGSGYDIGYSLLHGSLEPHWWQAPAKLLATAICAVSGIPGGIFSPSLSVGAEIGGEIAALFPATPMQGIILLAMAAYFAGVTQAPITAFVVVLEITGKGTTAVPLIAAALIASAVSRLFCPKSLYHALAKNFIIEVKKHQAHIGAA